MPNSMNPIIPNGPFREAFLASGCTASEIARRIDWYDAKGKGDSNRVMRRLGLTEFNQKGKKKRTKGMHERTAIELAKALHKDPVDLGF